MRMVFPGLVICALCSRASAQWTAQASGTTARLRGLAVVSGDVAWACGTGGRFTHTADGGKTWKAGTVPGASSLDFRDVHADDAETAYLLSIGAGEQSRIYKTSDGGLSWTLRHVNREPRGFLDAISFWDADRGLALGDPVDGRFMLLATGDGGKTWEPTPREGMPPALAGEGAFAASGTCLAVGGDGRAWFGTGGARASRVFRSTDRGRTWTAHETPVRAATPSSGIFSLAFRDGDHGVVVGGDYKEPGRSGNVAALTSDGGRTWRLPDGQGPAGYRSAIALMPGTQGRTLLAVGPTGTDVSADGGETWRRLGATGFHAVGFGDASAGWAVGEDGLIARLGGVNLKGR